MNIFRHARKIFSSLPSVKIAPIARGHAGKTACFGNLPVAVQGSVPATDYHFGSTDPRKVAGSIRLGRLVNEDLENDGITSTQVIENETIELRKKGKTAVKIEVYDTVGQVITGTTLTSAKEEVERYNEFISLVNQANVLWTFLSLPSSDSPRAQQRFKEDLILLQSYLELALTNRPQRCSIILAISKIDTVFDSERRTREELEDGRLTGIVRPLMDIVTNNSRKVSNAALFPFSSLGFGTSRPHKNIVDPEFGETEYVLNPGEISRPFNLRAMVLYSVVSTLKVPGALKGSKRENARQIAELDHCFSQANPCYIPFI